MTLKVSSRVIIDMPRAAAWDKLRDISLAHNYVPGIIKTEIVSDKNEGVGASRYVYRNSKSYIQETVEEWDEGRGFLLRIHKGDNSAPPFKNAWFRYDLAEEGSNQTRLDVSLTFEMPLGSLGRWLEKKMAKVVRATVSDVAISMKLFYETGTPSTGAALKAYKASASAATTRATGE
jgi:hypothetical protein